MLRSSRREWFAQHLASGLSQAEAYRRAGYVDDTGNAAKLTANGSVHARVCELRMEDAEAARLTGSLPSPACCASPIDGKPHVADVSSMAAALG